MPPAHHTGRVGAEAGADGGFVRGGGGGGDDEGDKNAVDEYERGGAIGSYRFVADGLHRLT